MKTLGLDRVVIVVKDLEKSAKRYSELLGTSFWDAGVQEKQGFRAMFSWEGQIELVSPISAQSGAAKFLEKKGEGIFGVAWKVEDIDEAQVLVDKHGFKMIHKFEFTNTPEFKLFKEIVLHPSDFSEVPIILVQSERK
jgi:methylmalonyl-CoA/ethylmalonyl-CoA epimerase